jgi:hypothetical protein
MSLPTEPQGESGKNDTKTYQQEYYRRNKRRLAAQKRARYEADTKYRERIRNKALSKHREKREKLLAERKPGWKPKKRGYNKPRVMEINGRKVSLHSPAEFADLAEISVQTIGIWEERGILPPPALRDEKGRRWYEQGYMKKVAAVVREYKAEGGFQRAALKERIAKALQATDVG